MSRFIGLFLIAVLAGCSAPAEEVGAAATVEPSVSPDEVVCEDYLADLPGDGYLSLGTSEVEAFGDQAAARLSDLADQVEDPELADALRAEAEMWDADEDFYEGPQVLSLCSDLLGDRADELLGG